MSCLNIATIRECTTSEGIGKRFAIWTQGCLKKCKGCCNKEMQSLSKNKIIQTEDLIKLIQKSVEDNEIEGITFLGGEPLIQTNGIFEIAKWCKSNNLSVTIFTGYLYEELLEVDEIGELLNYVDILIDGEFKEELYDEKRSFVGSTNQRILYLSNFYEKGDMEDGNRYIEVILEEKKCLINGWPFDKL